MSQEHKSTQEISKHKGGVGSDKQENTTQTQDKTKDEKYKRQYFIVKGDDRLVYEIKRIIDLHNNNKQESPEKYNKRNKYEDEYFVIKTLPDEIIILDYFSIPKYQKWRPKSQDTE